MFLLKIKNNNALFNAYNRHNLRDVLEKSTNISENKNYNPDKKITNGHIYNNQKKTSNFKLQKGYLI